MVEKTLSDLFLAQLKDIYYAEKKIFRTLPKMVNEPVGGLGVFRWHCAPAVTAIRSRSEHGRYHGRRPTVLE